MTEAEGEEAQGTGFWEEVGHNFYDLILKVRRDLHPYLDLEGQFDDNIYRRHDNIESDFITTVNPGITYSFIPTPIEGRTTWVSELKFNLNGEIVRYAEHGNLNRDTLDRSFLGGLNVEGVFFDRVNAYFDLQKTQTIAAELYPDRGTAPSRSSRDRLVDYWRNSYGASYDMGSERHSWILGYDHKGVAYITEEDKANSEDSENFSLSNYNYVLEDLQLFFSGTYGIVKRYKRQNADGNYTRFSTGFTGQFAPKIDGTVSAGYTIWNGENGGDTDSFVWNIQLGYELSPRLDLNFNASRSIQTSAEALEAAEAEETEAVRDPFGDTDIRSQYAKVDTLSLRTRYRPAFDEKLSLGAGGFYTKNRYDDGRETESYDFTAESSYEIRDWLNLGVSYTFRDQTSNREDEGYKNNIVTLTLNAEF